MVVHLCVILVISVVAMATGAKNQKQRENSHFCNLCDT